MEENRITGEQTLVTAQTAEAEENKGAKDDVSPIANGKEPINKFKSEDELARAYKNLEAEFTRKCQRITALEQELKKCTSEAENAKSAPPSPQTIGAMLSDREFLEQNILCSEEIQNKIIGRYIRSLTDKKPPVYISHETGIPTITPAIKPKTISEAGELAKLLLAKQ